jgi:alpha-ketoglutarate-dependent taurine dioxygenase
MNESGPNWKVEVLQPFGVEVTSPTAAELASVPPENVRSWVAEHRFLLLRGFKIRAQEAMLEYCRRLGEILEWEFGAVNELQTRADAKNYLYTNREVPFHWDGAFAGRIPHYIFFACEQAPPAGSGGETLFCDTVRLVCSLPPKTRTLWEGITITYSTEKVVHYGGAFTSAMIAAHPKSGEPVLRFAEPVDDLNPVRLDIEGLPPALRGDFLRETHQLLRSADWCYAHAWRDGDILIADNHALLHGRRAFAQSAPRHLRRVNIL